jgi:type I restriction enzyme S subunit
MSAIIDYRGKTPRKTDAGVPLITAKIVKGGRIEVPTEFVDPREYEDWMRRGLPRVGDVLLTTEAPLGEVAQLADARVALAQRLILLRGKPGVLDNTYLKFLMMSVEVQSQLQGRASGTTVVGIKQSELRKIELSLPPFDIQRAIVGVLGALDDKIEQTRRTARALERLARAIFRAWFVDFEPVKAKAAGATAFPSMPQPVFDVLPTRIVDSAIGPVPEGWNVGRLGDIAVQRRDGVQPADIDPETPYIGLEHMPRHSITLTEWEQVGKVTSGKARFREGQILFGKLRPYFHKVGVAPIDGVCSTDIVVMEPKESLWLAVVLGHVSSDAFVAHATACSTGTKMPRSNYRDMASYKVAIPPKAAAASLVHIVRPMLALLTAGIFEARKLAAMRDYLLPKLLKGEVRVGAK